MITEEDFINRDYSKILNKISLGKENLGEFLNQNQTIGSFLLEVLKIVNVGEDSKELQKIFQELVSIGLECNVDSTFFRYDLNLQHPEYQKILYNTVNSYVTNSKLENRELHTLKFFLLQKSLKYPFLTKECEKIAKKWGKELNEFGVERLFKMAGYDSADASIEVIHKYGLKLPQEFFYEELKGNVFNASSLFPEKVIPPCLEGFTFSGNLSHRDQLLHNQCYYYVEKCVREKSLVFLRMKIESDNFSKNVSLLGSMIFKILEKEDKKLNFELVKLFKNTSFEKLKMLMEASNIFAPKAKFSYKVEQFIDTELSIAYLIKGLKSKFEFRDERLDDCLSAISKIGNPIKKNLKLEEFRKALFLRLDPRQAALFSNYFPLKEEELLKLTKAIFKEEDPVSYIKEIFFQDKSQRYDVVEIFQIVILNNSNIFDPILKDLFSDKVFLNDLKKLNEQAQSKINLRKLCFLVSTRGINNEFIRSYADIYTPCNKRELEYVVESNSPYKKRCNL